MEHAGDAVKDTPERATTKTRRPSGRDSAGYAQRESLERERLHRNEAGDESSKERARSFALNQQDSVWLQIAGLERLIRAPSVAGHAPLAVRVVVVNDKAPAGAFKDFARLDQRVG